MMVKKNEKNQFEGDITYKQTWKIAYNFAKKSREIFPEFDENQLARLFRGSIYYYHEDLGRKLSKEEASNIIENDISVPQHYIDQINQFLKKNKNKMKSNKKITKKPKTKIISLKSRK